MSSAHCDGRNPLAAARQAMHWAERLITACSKRCRLELLPRPSSLIDFARSWVTEKTLGEALGPGRWANRQPGGRMLQVRSESGEMRNRDDDGLSTSNRAQSGEPLSTAQNVARHSTAVLTASRDTHLDLADQHCEVEKFGALLGTNRGQNPVSEGHQRSPRGPNPAKTTEAGNDENPRKSRVLAQIQAEREGFEPSIPLRGLRFSRPVQSTTLPPLRDGLTSNRVRPGSHPRQPHQLRAIQPLSGCLRLASD
jgi:hypothetical protein